MEHEETSIKSLNNLVHLDTVQIHIRQMKIDQDNLRIREQHALPIIAMTGAVFVFGVHAFLTLTLMEEIVALVILVDVIVAHVIAIVIRVIVIRVIVIHVIVIRVIVIRVIAAVNSII